MAFADEYKTYLWPGAYEPGGTNELNASYLWPGAMEPQLVVGGVVTDPSVNILTTDAGADLTTWTAADGASKGALEITFPQEAAEPAGNVTFQFAVGRFELNTVHHFTGFVTPTTLSYEHTDIKWFVRNDTTGETSFHQLTFDGHTDQGGQDEAAIGEAKPFNIVFYSTDPLDQFTVGFENFANNQLGCVFDVSNLGVFIII